jgi:hypothetical protein
MAPNRLTPQWLRLVLAALALGALAILGGCGGGSGAPNNPFAPGPVSPGPLSILPSAPTVFSNTPTTLTITGGVAPYFVVSSNTAVLPLGASVTNGTIVLLPANVLADTVVVITAQDSAGTKATATVTVKPAPIFNALTVTPASTACGTNTVCSGQTATAKVTVTGAGGVGLPNRQVKFDVVSGAFAIESNNPATPLVSTLTVVSDQFGVAQVVIQATAGVPTQPALLRATELTTGNQQTAQFTIVQTIDGSAVLSVVPSSVTFLGPDNTSCSNNFRVDYFIFGGKPPYQVAVTPSFPVAVVLSNIPVTAAGGSFTAITNGICLVPGVGSDLTFVITDAEGLKTTAALHNLVGTKSPFTGSPLAIVPGSYAQTSCNPSMAFSFVIVGGQPPYNVSLAFNTGGTPTVDSVVLPASGESVTVTGVSGTGTVSVVVIDSGIPQGTTNATITCS